MGVWFRRKHSENIEQLNQGYSQNGECPAMGENGECASISKIRTLQGQLNEVESKLRELDSFEEYNCRELSKFFNSHYIRRMFSGISPGCEVHAIIRAIQTDIDDVDVLMEEIKAILDKAQLIREKRKEAASIKRDILEEKKKLNIE